VSIGFRSTRMPIGVEVGGRYLNAIQLGRVSGGFGVEAATSIRRSAGDASLTGEEVARLADVLERQDFRGQDVVLALPTTRMMSALLELPPANSGAPLDRLSRAELATTHECDPARLQSAYWELPAPARPREGTSVMAVGCFEDDACALVDVFQDAGLNVVAIDVAAWAISRACAPILSSEAHLAAALNLEWDSASLIVILDEIVVYERALADTGLSRLHGALVNDLDLDADVADYVLREIGLRADLEDQDIPTELARAARESVLGYVSLLAPEVRVSLGYAAQEYGKSGVDRLVMVGEGASVPGLADQLSNEFSLTARVVAPTQLADCPERLRATCSAPALTAAFGLSLYQGDR
jgi:Tfp pilus assembly PilM family ATPase